MTPSTVPTIPPPRDWALRLRRLREAHTRAFDWPGR